MNKKNQTNRTNRPNQSSQSGHSSLSSQSGRVQYIQSRYTYDAVAGVVRNRRSGRAVKGTLKPTGYLKLDMRSEGVRREVFLHHMVWVLCRGRWPSQIDHLNGNPRDNRIENLREATRRENDANRLWTWRPNAKTGLPGVCLHPNQMYMIKVDSKRYYFRDRYEAFVTQILLGRMFKEPP